MADLFIAEAATNGLAGYPKDTLMHKYYDQVLAMHGVTKAEYEATLRILVNDENHMEQIEMQVMQLLEPNKKQESGQQPDE